MIMDFVELTRIKIMSTKEAHAASYLPFNDHRFSAISAVQVENGAVAI